MSNCKLIAISILGALLAGCPSTPVPDPEPTDTTVGASNGASTEGMDDLDGHRGSAIPDPFEQLGTVIYFDFDSSEVRAQDHELVSGHAIKLNEDTRTTVRLEGHADERGSREYNIGLGERRAQAVRQMLMIQGVSAAQIQTVSFGEERPESMGSSESDYARNRRVVIRYTN